MSIDTSGKYWTGTGPEDIDEYLRALTADGYRVDRTVHAKCTCGNDVFALHADAEGDAPVVLWGTRAYADGLAVVGTGCPSSHRR